MVWPAAERVMRGRHIEGSKKPRDCSAVSCACSLRWFPVWPEAALAPQLGGRAGVGRKLFLR